MYACARTYARIIGIIIRARAPRLPQHYSWLRNTLLTACICVRAYPIYGCRIFIRSPPYDCNNNIELLASSYGGAYVRAHAYAYPQVRIQLRISSCQRLNCHHSRMQSRVVRSLTRIYSYVRYNATPPWDLLLASSYGMHGFESRQVPSTLRSYLHAIPAL